MTMVRPWGLLVGVSVLAAGACSSTGVRPPDESHDDTQEDAAAATSTIGEFATSSSAAANADSTPDGGGVSLAMPMSSSAESDAEVSSTLGEGATSGSTSLDLDASVILQPEFEEMSVDRLCEQVANLEGRSVDVDLSSELQVSEWQDVASGVLRLDAGEGDNPDAMACGHRFAVYVAPCRGSTLVVTAPTLAFGAGPTVGGEQVGVGCWETDCVGGCLPEASVDIGKVRVRVAAPVNSRYDAALDVYVGDIRVNGVDVEGIAQLEVLERL